MQLGEDFISMKHNPMCLNGDSYWGRIMIPFWHHCMHLGEMGFDSGTIPWVLFGTLSDVWDILIRRIQIMTVALVDAATFTKACKLDGSKVFQLDWSSPKLHAHSANMTFKSDLVDL